MWIALIGLPMVTKMKIIARALFVLLLASVQPSSANSLVVFLGSFSNQQQSISEDPHIEGYSLTLYRQGNIVFGRFCWATGIEAPCAPIQNAVIDRAGRITFKTKLSIGKEFSKDAGVEGHPACRVIKFRGKIRENSIPGVVSVWSIYTPQAPAETETVKLKRVPFKGGSIQSYQEWALDPQNKPID